MTETCAGAIWVLTGVEMAALDWAWVKGGCYGGGRVMRGEWGVMRGRLVTRQCAGAACGVVRVCRGGAVGACRKGMAIWSLARGRHGWEAKVAGGLRRSVLI